jgi:putative flippase GtrA
MIGYADMLSVAVIRFALVGVTSSLAYLAVIALLTAAFGWNNTPAVVAAYLVGTIISYIASVVFAFRAEMKGSNFAKFLVVVGLSFLANILVSEFLTSYGVAALAIGVTNVILVGAFNFVSHKYWTFRS